MTAKHERAGLDQGARVGALPILILLMEKLEILRTALGQRILRYASLDDIAIWGVLALILLDWARIGRQGGFLIAFALAAYFQYDTLIVAWLTGFYPTGQIGL